MTLPLYNLALRSYDLLIRLAVPFHPKAARLVAGRRDWLPRLRTAQAAWAGAPVLWMHCASLGEFEQGRPVLEALRRRHRSALKLLVTFFSPSGYDIRHSWAGADYVAYLPADSAANAAAFLDTVRPTAAVFVKYEFWHHYLHGLQARQVPTFLIAAALRADQPFFKPWGGLFRALLRCFTHIFTQNQTTADLLTTVGLPPTAVTVAGDPRYDRVLATAETASRLPLLEAFVRDGSPVLVVGSAWPEDLRALAPALRRHIGAMRVIIAPHEVGEADVRAVETALAGVLTLRYSQARAQFDGSAAGAEQGAAADLLRATRVLIIDNIGLLATLYGYAAVAYVGGAFGRGLHNILEAATFGAPVLFGPHIGRFPEAAALIAAGGGRSVQSAEELEQQLTTWLTDQEARARAGAGAAAFVRQNAGATPVIMAGLAPWLPQPTDAS